MNNVRAGRSLEKKWFFGSQSEILVKYAQLLRINRLEFVSAVSSEAGLG